MKTVTEAEFKEHLQEFIDGLDEAVVEITRHGLPVARVVPVSGNLNDTPGRLFSELYGKFAAQIPEGDDFFTTERTWDAQS